MKIGSVYESRAGCCVVPRVWRAAGRWDRMRGLLGRPRLVEGEGMLIESCGMVHTFGMTYRLDLAFLDKQWRVCKLVADLAPARCAGSLLAGTTLELAPGTLDRIRLSVGDVLTWKEAAQ